MTEVILAQLSRHENGKDPNDLHMAGVLKEAIKEAICEATKTHEVDFPFLYPDDMDVIESDEYLIEDWVPEGGVHLLYAKKDCLKSFLAVDWFMCVVSGEPWNGFETKQGLGVYIAGEGNRGLKRRFKAWRNYHGKQDEDLHFVLSKWPTQVLDAEVIKEWAEHIQKVEEHFGEPARFIVVDTLATNFGPGDENSPTDMARFLAHLSIYLRRDTDVTILVIHHTGKDTSRGPRGGYSIEANAEAVYEIERVEETGKDWDRTIKLKCKHLKDDDKPSDMILKAEVVELDINGANGEPMTSLVLVQQLSPRDTAVLEQTNAGRSQREIASYLGVSKTLVQRTQRRLKEQNLLDQSENR